MSKPKILLIDIETFPNIVHVWGLFQQNVGINQIVKSGTTCCVAAKWLGSTEVMYFGLNNTSAKGMLKKVHKLLEEADMVIHYNGNKFDIPTLNKEFIKEDINPPAPFHQIDLLRVARKQFRFTSNKLDYVAQFLGLGSKVHHKGHSLWIGCMNKDADSWKEMEKYNKQDVVLLEKVYKKMLPWIKNHPIHSINVDHSCPNCGSSNLQSRGYATSNTGVFKRYACNDCGTWSQSRFSELKSTKKILKQVKY